MAEEGKPRFQLKQGETGLSTFDAGMVTSEDVLAEFRPGSMTVELNVDQDLVPKGLAVKRTLGEEDLSDKLRLAHVEIVPGSGMSRPGFKKALRELETLR